MRGGLKISHKGLILVAIPVLFELLFVSLLIFMLQQAEADLRQEIKSKEIIYTAGVFGRNVAEGASSIAAYSTTKSEYFKEKYFGNKKEIHNRLKGLKKLLKEAGRNSQLKEFKKLEAATAKGERVLEKLLKSTDRKIAGQKSDFSFHGPLAMLHSKQLLGNVIKSAQNIIDREKLLEESYLDAASKSRERLKYLIMGFVVFNIFLAVILANFFSKSITKRIKSVIQNTQRVPKGEELTPPIGGGDEIAELDVQFHQMVDELYKAQKMKQYLLSMVSHDLRSPLTSVQGVLTMLGAGAFGEISEKAKYRVQTAEKEVIRLITLTNDLLDVEKLASGNLEMELKNTNSYSIIEATVGSMTAFAEQHGIRIKAPPSDIEFRGDKDRLVQVLVNLVSNSIKYSYKGDTVTVKAESNDQAVVFSVKDQGRGIPEDFIERVFDKFQQVEESDSSEKGGKGLGLAISKSIVEAHGGEISVDSTYGVGSTFWFSIPLNS